MSVKAVCIKGHWSVRVNWHRRRATRQVKPNTQDRAFEVAEKLTIALELYGADALVMLDEPKPPLEKTMPTVAEYARKWVAELASTGLKRRTREAYAYLVKNHVVPPLGSRPLNELSYAMLKDWVIERGKGRAGSTVRTMVAALRAMMNEAVIEGHVAANPVEHLGRFCRITKGQKVKIDPLGLNELHRVEAKCAERFPEHYGLLLLLARTGMRFGEVVGLQWQDVDEHRGQLLVRRNMARHRQAEAPKTPASERRVDLSPEMLEELKRLRRERRTQIFKAGREWNEEEWIFRNKRGRPIIYADFHSHVWTGLLRLAGLRHRGIHQLRHSWASHMLASGADLAYVAAQLGHSSPAVTLEIYTHWVPGTARVTAAIFDRRNANEMQTQTEDGVRPEQERQ